MATPLGEIIYIAVKPIFKIYLIFAVGFWLARKNILDVQTSKNISAMTLQVLIPCLAFNKILTNISYKSIKEIGTIALVFVFMTTSGAIGTTILGVLMGCPREWFGGLMSCGIFPNISDLPIAYLQSMETSNVFANVDQGVAYVVIYMALQMVVQFNLGGFKLIEMDFKGLFGKSLDEEEEIESPKDAEDRPRQLQEPSTDSEDTTKDNANDSEDHSEDAMSAVSSLASAVQSTRSRPQRLYESTSNRVSRLGSRVSNLSKLSRKSSVASSLLTNRDASKPKENIDDIVRVYSRYDQVKKEWDEKSTRPEEEAVQHKNVFQKFIHSVKTADYKKLLKDFGSLMLTSTLQPASMTVIISITLTMIPWTRALFVHNHEASLPDAPDRQPPLSFLMDFAQYIGNAQVPMGLLMLGGTIGRLSLRKLPKGVWKTPVAVTLFRLFVFPVIGCAFNSKIQKDGLFYNQPILHLIANMNFCLPPATALIYITAFYTPADASRTLQMDILALTYICHYICLAVCLPFVTSYTMKVALGF